MSSHHLYQVEFVGGPYDGFLVGCCFPPDDLAPVTILAVNQSILRLIEGEKPEPNVTPTSVAIYSLENRNGAWQYQHVFSTSVKALAVA